MAISDDVLVVGVASLERETDGVVLGGFDVPHVRDIDSVAGLARAVGAERVVLLPGPNVDDALLRRVSWLLEEMPVTLSLAMPLAGVACHRLRPLRLSGASMVDLAAPRASTASQLLKAALDRVAAAVSLLVLAPLMLAVCLAVRLDSRGPGLFSQIRVGKDGRPFRILKFRTMYTNAEDLKASLVSDNEVDGALFKIRRDPRVTRVGRALRRTSLDELPQLVNVLLGHMSLVGPRPALPDEVATYDFDTRRRLAVRPGITGLWQVSGRSNLAWEQAVNLDLYYTDNWTLSGDLVIAARTVRAVTSAQGAY